MICFRLALWLFGLALCAAPAVAETLDCHYPVRMGESAKSLLARIGARAKIVTMKDEEGNPFRAVILFGGDPKRRLVAWFVDDTLSHVEGVFAESGATAWSVRGLKVGSTLAQVEAANGGPIDVEGFGSDLAGRTTMRGGALDKPVASCYIGIHLKEPVGAQASPAISDGEIHPSTDPDLRALAPIVAELSVAGP